MSERSGLSEGLRAPRYRVEFNPDGTARIEDALTGLPAKVVRLTVSSMSNDEASALCEMLNEIEENSELG
jgi:hypothetical protein